MAKKQTGVIALEIEKFEKKIKQYQDYLERNNILLIVDDATRHKEIAAQNTIMDRLPVWLESLRKLREDTLTKKEVETYGDVKINTAYDILKEKK